MTDPEGDRPAVERTTDLGRRPQPPLHTSGEREMLEAMLEWYRAGVLHKVRGVDAELAAATPLASATSIAGLVKHLAMVEDSWWAVDFAGEAEAEWYQGVDWDADPDWEFRTAVDEPLEVNLARYEAALERCRRIAAGRSLDDIGADTSRHEFSLRFVHLHLIEETARHLGHLDVLRELLDGTTGD